MNPTFKYEVTKSSFEYLGKYYAGDVVSSSSDFKIYWFVFDQIDVKPFGGSIEFRLVNGQLESVKEFPEYKLFILCIKGAIDKHRMEECN